MSKDVFLSNIANKQNFIDILSHYLQLAGCVTEHAEKDADLLIAHRAVQSAATKNTVFVADDADLVILLCYYADPDGFDLLMLFSTRGTTKKNRIWDIKVTQSELGADICNNTLFIHAILGCDTTSRLYGLGKGVLLKILCNFQLQTKINQDHTSIRYLGTVMNLEFIFTLYKVRTRLDPMKGGVTICGRTPQA